MASDIKIQLGQFLRQRLEHPDTSADEFAPSDVLTNIRKSFVDIAVPPDISKLRPTKVAPAEPAPTINLPRPLPSEGVPLITPTRPTAFQKSPPLRKPLETPVSRPPDVTPTLPAGRQPSPEPVLTGPSPAQPSLATAPTSPSPFQTLPTISPIPPTPLGAVPTLQPYPPPGPPIVAPSTSPVSVSPFQQLPPGANLTEHVPAALRAVDRQVADFLNAVDGQGDPLGVDPTKGPYSSFGGGAPGTRDWDARLFAKHMLRLAHALGPAGLSRHSATQLALFALNRHGRIWNPELLGPPPVARDFTVPAIDITTGLPPNDSLGVPLNSFRPGFYEKNEKQVDRHLQRAKGTYVEVVGLSSPPFVGAVVAGGAVGPQNILNNALRIVGAASQDSSLVDDPVSNFGLVAPGTPLLAAAQTQRNMYGPNVHYSDNPLYTIGELVKGQDGKDSDLLKKDGASGIERVDISSLFSSPRQGLDSPMVSEYRPKPNNTRIRGDRPHDPLEKSYYRQGIVPAGFPEENDSGFLQRNASDPPKIDDDDAYVPLFFTDVRPYGNNKVRSVYFRPFITSLTEELNPEWSSMNGFGRVDPIKTYGGTTRTISLSFVVHAFAPKDLKLIYKKLTWLSSMVYPEYDVDMLYKSGPIARMRIGDLISSNNPGGLAGTIDQLSIEYSDQIWELAKDSKVPMGYRVSLSFTVLHDVPIGRGADGKFGGLGTIDGSTGLYKAPLRVTSDAKEEKGPEVNDSLDFRGFKDADVVDYDPTE